MSEANGKSRLDRIEEVLDRHSAMLVSMEKTNREGHERFLAENQAAHDRFEEEHKRLLTAQILMNGALQKLAETTEKLAETTEKLAETTDRVVIGLDRLELKMEETTDKLNGLIATVDGIIRRPEAG